MFLKCPFIMKMYRRLLLHVIFYFKEKNNWKISISGKSDIG